MVWLHHDPAAYAALHTSVRQQMGEAAYRAAVAEARAMSVDEVADLAHACLDPRAPAAAAPWGSAPALPIRKAEVEVVEFPAKDVSVIA
jgi:hypothetical protein